MAEHSDYHISLFLIGLQIGILIGALLTEYRDRNKGGGNE